MGKDTRGREAEGVGNKLGGYADAHTITAHRAQFLSARFALMPARAALIAEIAFGGAT